MGATKNTRERREETRVSPRARVFSCAHLFPSACYAGYHKIGQRQKLAPQEHDPVDSKV